MKPCKMDIKTGGGVPQVISWLSKSRNLDYNNQTWSCRDKGGRTQKFFPEQGSQGLNFWYRDRDYLGNLCELIRGLIWK